MKPQKTNRNSSKAKGRLFKLQPNLDAYLKKEGDKAGKTMTGILEELLAYRMRFKHFPPDSTQKKAA